MQTSPLYFNNLKRETVFNLAYYANTTSHAPSEYPLVIDTTVSAHESYYYYCISDDKESLKTFNSEYPFQNTFNHFFEDVLECNSPLSSPEIMATQSPLYNDYLSAASFSPTMATLVDTNYFPESSLLDTGSEFYQSSVSNDCTIEQQQQKNKNYIRVKEEPYSMVYSRDSCVNTHYIDSQELNYSNTDSSNTTSRSNRDRINSISSITSSSENESFQTPASDTPSYSFDNYTLANSSNTRPYSCHFCSRAFARKHDLQRHIRVHTGEKPYACPCCKKAFSRTDALKRHLRMEEQCRNSKEVYEMKKNGKRRYRNL